MKRFVLVLTCLLATTCCFAQLFKPSKDKDKGIDPKYNVGTVPVVAGKVLFEADITAPELSKQQIYEKALAWVKTRFVQPTVIASKMNLEDEGIIKITSEEYIVFSDKFLALDRTRINYFLELTCEDGKCNVKMTRIRYWYEEERNDGEHFTAEERITDEQAMNKKRTKFYKGYGKFRTKTIDLKDSIVAELTDAIQK